MKNVLCAILAATICTGWCVGQMQRHHTSPSLMSVPSSGTGGQAGGASNPANVAVITTNFPDAMITGSVKASVYCVHGRAADLTMTLSHCGTGVTLFAGSANQAASLNGYYTFDDAAAVMFAAAVNGAQGLVPPGAYKPSQPMSAFAGQSSTGPWVNTVADLAAGVAGTAGYMEMILNSGASYSWSTSPFVPIPDGSNGVCSSPITESVTPPASGQVGEIWVAVGLEHTYASDLTITLTHAGVTATLVAANNPSSPANLQGSYIFDDAATTTWAQAISGLPTSATVPPGWYRPMTPLSVFAGLDQAGPWTLSVCDQYAFDTGSLWGLTVAIGTSAWDLQIQQPNGPASVTLTNSGGRMGDSYANLMTLVPGSFPNGGLFGLDITMPEILSEASFGAPFFGPLGSCGSASTTIPGPIPSGITVWVTSIDVGPTVAIVNHKPAFTYTTP